MKFAPIFDHFTRINDEIVILKLQDQIDERELQQNGIYPFTDALEKEITKRFNSGDVIGPTEGYVCCYSNGKTTRVFYDDSMEMPDDKKIYHLPKSKGELIYLDSTKMKEFLKKKK